MIDSRDRLIDASELRGGLAADDAVREQAIAKYNELCAAAQIPATLCDAAILHAARLGGDATACVRAACAALDALAERVRRDWPGDVGAFGSDEWRELNEAIVRLRPYAADGGGQAGQASAMAAMPSARHSPDFRSVHWYGTAYSFTALQAPCVKVLWEAWENGTPDVGNGTILAEAGTDESRLPDIFRGCAAWGTMIVPGDSKGTTRLKPA
ncbi:MAG: hypothetical protein L6R00_12360 [Phycisphaerae bacterium]|nr:hypothetical protein [Phycisphaerae bacterium]